MLVMDFLESKSKQFKILLASFSIALRLILFIINIFHSYDLGPLFYSSDY